MAWLPIDEAPTDGTEVVVKVDGREVRAYAASHDAVPEWYDAKTHRWLLPTHYKVEPVKAP